MDHIPKPPQYIAASIDVPLVALIPYDFDTKDFSRFPERHGFLDKDGNLDLNRSVTEVASLLQSWLYFGLLAEFAGRSIDVNSFRRDIETGPLVDSAAIETLAQQRAASLNDLSYESQISRDRAFLNNAAFALDCIEAFDFHPVGRQEPIPTVALSIKVLIASLQLYIDLGSTDIRLRPIESTSNTALSPAGRLLARKLREAGWCPFRVVHVCRGHNYAAVYHLLQLSRPNPYNVSHRDCTEQECLASTTNVDQYIVRHTADECHCEMVDALTADVERIIDEGGIPLVEIKQSGNGNVTVNITKAGPLTYYVAISHVWSDGLGNPSSNSLPSCQVERLRTYLSHFPVPGFGFNILMEISFTLAPRNLLGQNRRAPRLFWIDTFCIPVSNAELRQKAINQMAGIYAGAGSVLVLDSEIQHLQIDKSNQDHLISYLPGCAWGSRCWTLQESSLNNNCYMQCASTAIDPLRADVGSSMSQSAFENKLLRRIYECILNEFEERSRNLGISNHRNPSSMVFSHFGRDQASFVAVWNALSLQTTSRKEDTYAILANLLRFNAFFISKSSTPLEKMRAMIFALQEIPLSLLYNEGPRERSREVHYDRWLPTLPIGGSLTAMPILVRDPNGFSLLSESTKIGTTPFIIRIESQIPKQCQSVILECEPSQKYLVEMLRDPHDELDPKNYQGTCFVLEHDFRKPYTNMTRGACLQIEGIEEFITPVARNKEEKVFSEENQTNSRGSHITTIYDCPLRVWPYEDGMLVEEVLQSCDVQLSHARGQSPSNMV
ncbi:hypothetical protein F5884DRAFT_885368 [Xylogone sp. PMI_703]|nr:hypothetical protein F5884DRAFT_885368 [Xylogone sp. PMI_703]